MSSPVVTEIILHRASRILEVAFDGGERFHLPAEYLRTHSPSAEVQGHGPGQRTLVWGRRYIKILAVEPVGNYAVLLRFDDGHASGIFSWQVLHELGRNQDANWQSYLAAMEKAGLSREPGGKRKPQA
ncbi:DUF971 domain-containing protein [Dokdonella sp.]|uniref:DUF971 domain-containing protein n=1 Tax=Dokdonella sp. TaxID=2291710 RepID=UPI0025BA5162|nr:DUF971 domain-containing protein [Dokdonella sp.]MBX3689765.1 DUF971 domain-containing protein [Dokdonella sp.]